jgi:hypothetical protein
MKIKLVTIESGILITIVSGILLYQDFLITFLPFNNALPIALRNFTL